MTTLAVVYLDPDETYHHDPDCHPQTMPIPHDLITDRLDACPDCRDHPLEHATPGEWPTTTPAEAPHDTQ